jgi:hypothetical protein
MAGLRNDPRAQEKPAPLYLNDPNGFWTNNAKRNPLNWRGLMPDGTRIELDLAQSREVLRQSITWSSVVVRWGKIQFRASLDDGQAGAPLEAGGMGATGQVTLVFSKSLFEVGGTPAQHDTFQLMVGAKWKSFQVTSISEGFDDADDALICFIEPEDSEK